jgi:2-amino-4-hydroxy-6-hydroxymethyldihydropteridine diphosphokinase
MIYHLGLGSNIGEREANLLQAAVLLKKNRVDIIKKSSIYETSPVGNTRQPWFLNQVMEVQSDTGPRGLLQVILGIEKSMGRARTTHQGPRCIDIDILLAEGKVIHSADLMIPHPELAERNFVLVPLKEIAPDTVHPVSGKKIEDLWRRSKDRSIVRLYIPA